MILPNVLLFCIVFQYSLSPGSTFDYCTLGKDNTMCVYKEKKLGSICGSGSQIQELTDEQKKLSVSEHNKLRSEVALGKYASTCCPKAAKMLEMEWDDELYEVVHRWVMQCDYQHDVNRNVERFHCGQNIFKKWGPNYMDDDEAIIGAIKSWYDEVKDVKKEDFKKGHKGGGIGHFTQEVWGTTNLVGCAIQKFLNGSDKVTYVGCNYGPAGNVFGENLYLDGEPCSKCPAGTHCSKEYKGLCSRSGSGGGNGNKGSFSPSILLRKRFSSQYRIKIYLKKAIDVINIYTLFVVYCTT